MEKEIKIFDSTLRDGAQAESISFTVEDKIKVVNILDSLGIKYIEAGNPGSNPKDLEFFQKVKNIKLLNSKLVAFGSTRRSNINIDEDKNVQSLLSANTEVVAIFGKSWDFHVIDIIHTTLEENLNMIEDTISFFKSESKEVIFDAEHFFDGYKSNAEYALKTLEAAVNGGTDCLSLCDTNGGMFPLDIYEIVKCVVERFPNVDIGIHCHNDGGMAVANSILAVQAGAVCVQGTYLGFGERCGNANLSTIIANLQLKKQYNCIDKQQIQNLTPMAYELAEIANVKVNKQEAYIGKSAFSHKGGMHIDGVSKSSASFEHINPETVGNERKFLMSEVAGRSTIISKIQKIKPSITRDSEETQLIIDALKELEYRGYQFEGAEGSFELLVRKKLGKYKPFFELEHFKIIGEQPTKDGKPSSSTLIKVTVDGKTEVTAAEGDGPVNALDLALRKALEVFYPALADIRLTDYKVRILDSKTATASKTRVLIESTDGKDSWTTVGVSTDIIEASWLALVDSIEYKLIKDVEEKFKAYL